jgi:hypothetical protein
MHNRHRRPISTVRHLADLLQRRFPLVPRTKPICRPLETRVARVRHLTHLAAQPTEDPLTRAAEAHNLAALIASDCGMADLAHRLCWQQYDALDRPGPVDAAAAKLRLQPLINLARLILRDGDGISAYHHLETPYHAVRNQTQAELDRRTINLANLVTDEHDHHELVRWLWTVMLADGTRALTRAGRWAEALQHAQRHNGIGQRLLDGRQVAILASTTARDHDRALQLLATTDTPTPWEKTVLACLKVACLVSAGQHTSAVTTTMLNQYLALEPLPDCAAFQARLGLCIIDLATDTDDSRVTAVATKIFREASDS